jgi:hypothetical protein
MWIASKYGFISIVAHWDDPNVFLIRAREKEDLLALFEEEMILETPDADYAFRVLIGKEKAMALLTDMLNEVDYPNFKSAVGRNPDQKHKVHAYQEIWSIMRQFQA